MTGILIFGNTHYCIFSYNVPNLSDEEIRIIEVMAKVTFVGKNDNFMVFSNGK